MELQGKVAIVTGAGRGIGRATALELARMGADIVVAELDRANAEDTASELRGLGRRALVVQTDVTSRDDLRAMVERTLAELGRIDTLVNNAGIYRAAQLGTRQTLELRRKARLPVHRPSACSGVKALRNTSDARRQAAKLCSVSAP